MKWNGVNHPPVTRTVADRYQLTVAGFVATLPRGACGHLLCSRREVCAWEVNPLVSKGIRGAAEVESETQSGPESAQTDRGPRSLTYESE